MKKNKEIKSLIKKYLSGQCTVEERHIVEKWYAEQLEARGLSTKEYDRTKIKDEIWQRIAEQRPVKIKKVVWWPRVAAAVAVVVGLFAIYQFAFTPDLPSEEAYVSDGNPIMPAGNNAILTTADGKKIALTTSAEGILDQGDGFEIKKEKDGLIVFDVKASNGVATTTYNTIETPKGGIYQVVLPDGSKAWLNNESSISFPTQFAASERLVKITGEVYFEVEHNAKRPFKVSTPQQEIEVLGTKFNINAYDDEPSVKTTLVEGSVRVKGASSIHVLRPGYEMVTQKDNRDKVSVANLKSVLAWKEGVFHFERVKLETLMRQLARWYDVELVYEGKLPQDEFVGEIRRSEDIHKVLEILKDGQIDINLEGRKLIVGRKK